MLRRGWGGRVPCNAVSCPPTTDRRPTASCCAPLPPSLPACSMLQLLHERKVKRVVLMSDGRTAIVEVPVENTESDFMSVTYDRRDVA